MELQDLRMTSAALFFQLTDRFLFEFRIKNSGIGNKVHRYDDARKPNILRRKIFYELQVGS